MRDTGYGIRDTGYGMIQIYSPLVKGVRGMFQYGSVRYGIWDSGCWIRDTLTPCFSKVINDNPTEK
jgi:hypothetical protein